MTTNSSVDIGSTSITTVGTITIGTWNGTAVDETHGGTNQTTYTLGDSLYASAANTLSKLSGNITAVKQYLSQTGTGAVSAAPGWATIAGGDITGAALTAGNDTNVTLTAGGTSATALLRAASITAGWAGQLSLTRGGTNASLTASNGGIVWSNATQFQILSGTATANQMLQSGSSATPAWSTATWPATTTINQILYSSAANTVTGLATANSGVLITSAGGVPSISSTLPSAVVANIPGRLTSFTILTSGTAATYTVPAGITSLLVECLGGGGGGGGIDATTGGGAGAGGGAGGGYARLWIASPGASYTYTVGAAGAAGAAGNNAGGNGTASTFVGTGANISASRGNGGGGSATSTVPAVQGTSGAAIAVTGGDINIKGTTGETGYTNNTGGTGVSIGGNGGGTYFGPGALRSLGGATGVAGNANSGQGGSGACASNNASTFAGGAGGTGIIIVWEFA